MTSFEVIAVWQRLDGGAWISFPPEASQGIEEAFKTANVAHFTLTSYRMTIDLNQMRDKSRAPIRRFTNQVIPETRWEYQDGRYWMDYTVDQCEQISMAKAAGREQTIIYTGPSFQAYVILFSEMVQIHGSSFTKVMVRFVPTAAPKGAQRTQMIENVMRNARMQLSCADTCSICLEDFNDAEYARVGFCLPSCVGHFFHRGCIQQQLENKGKCAVCSYMYIITEGNQPKSGTMQISFLPAGQYTLSGFEEHGTILIQYDFPSGTQGPEHPHPGEPYYGTVRYAFLPDTREGREVLGLLERAFNLRHTFAVGRYVGQSLLVAP